MLYLKSPASVETEVKKSRFLAEAFPVESQKDARDFLKSRKEKYADSTHVVHAFVTGSDGGVCGCSDDGEPSGTAGRPVLEVLKGSGITGCIITVTRWFGGTLLGTGGLVKAYSNAAKAVLSVSETFELVPRLKFSLELPYDAFGWFKRYADNAGVEIISQNFGSSAVIEGYIPADFSGKFSEEILDFTAGRNAPVFTEDF